MSSIHPVPKLVFVFDVPQDDGRVEFYLRIVAADGSVSQLPLSLDKALELSHQLVDAARRIRKAGKKAEPLQ